MGQGPHVNRKWCHTGRHPLADACSCENTARRVRSPRVNGAPQPISDAMFFPPLGRWAERAACVGEEDHTSNSALLQRAGNAERLCRGCPVRWACLEDALATHPDMDYHVRGGKTRAERQQIRRMRSR